MSHINNTKMHSGFTLIEVMVSVSIFAIVLTVGIGSLLTINNAHRKSQAQRAVIDNLNFVMESMVRELRIGTKYSCAPASTCSNAKAIKFIDSEGQPLVYMIQSMNGGVGRIIKNGGTGNEGGLTDPSLINIDVNQSKFVVVGNDPTDSQQAYVIISITGTSTVGNQSATYTLQTAVTQRVLDMQQVTP